MIQSLIVETFGMKLSSLNINGEQRQSNTANFSVPNVTLPIQSTPSINRSNCELNADKVSNTISSWHLKFSGDENEDLTIDNFLY